MSNVNEIYLDVFRSLDFHRIKDHPNILIAANFWDAERYQAAKAAYKFMRAIDDLIDDYKAAHKVIAENEKDRFINDVQHWTDILTGQIPTDPRFSELPGTFARFLIPFWPMEAFARSMTYDILNDGFPSLKAFLDYAEGASVAPAAIFVHLCGLREENGMYLPPLFDVGRAARPCAVFSYLVHIIRDFRKDQLNHLNYFADDLIVKYGMDRNVLYEMACGSPIRDGFRNMIGEYCIVADEYRRKTYDIIQEIGPYLESRYRLSLDIIFNLYLMIFERIDVEKGSFSTGELNPTPEEVKQKVYETILAFKP
ncbi:MAG TPA: squalene/phytoene synthase family protein [Bacteroidales bacterium]|jgi:phytoene synthase|nr:squalene/phytoene synthase family protein [Bacteroidales bacterium]